MVGGDKPGIILGSGSSDEQDTQEQREMGQETKYSAERQRIHRKYVRCGAPSSTEGGVSLREEEEEIPEQVPPGLGVREGWFPG